jgi:hypothetical protein
LQHRDTGVHREREHDADDSQGDGDHDRDHARRIRVQLHRREGYGPRVCARRMYQRQTGVLSGPFIRSPHETTDSEPSCG